MIQTVTGNLVEVSSTVWIEIFNGVYHQNNNIVCISRNIQDYVK